MAEGEAKPLKKKSSSMSITADTGSPFQFNPSDPFFKFNTLSPGIAEKIRAVDRSQFQMEGDDYNENVKKRIIETMSKKSNEALLGTTDLLNEFASRIADTLTRCNAWEGIEMWPPRILDPTEEAKAAIFILVELLSNARTPPGTLDWLKFISLFVVPQNTPYQSTMLKACCLCKRKRKLFAEDRNFWATLDVRNHFQLWVIENGELKLHMEADVSCVKLSGSGKTVKLFDSSGELLKRIIPIDASQNPLWATAMVPRGMRPKLPLFFGSAVAPVPDLVLFALNQALLSDDFLIVRAITNYQVISVTQTHALTEALFDIFAYAGKVNSLLMLLACEEFSNPQLQITTVLRGNSHLTNMFKVFFRRFGKKYYDDFLKRVVLYMDSKGDLKLKTPAEADSQKAKTMVFTIIQRLAGSLAHVPPEIRHFASILKSCAALRFNSKQATYNTLSGFFYLRFVSAIISNPLEVDPDLQLQSPWLAVLVPAAQLMMSAFNLIEMGGKYEVFNSWNKGLREQIFPKLIEFVFSVAIVEETPEYQVPSKERLKEALTTVLTSIGNSGSKFSEKYSELLKDSHLASPTGTNLACFIASYFEQNMSV